MLQLAFAYPTALEWMETRTGYSFTGNARGLFAVDEAGVIKGGVAWDQWTPNSCCMHQVLETPAAIRALVPECFRYPFVKAQKKIIYGSTPSNDNRALNLAWRFGFREEKRLWGGWSDGVDLVIMSLKREDCRWLNRRMRHEQR